MNGNFVWIAFFSVAAKMFSNSLLASLNQRGSSDRLATFNPQSSAGSSASTRVTFQPPLTDSIHLKTSVHSEQPQKQAHYA